MLVPSPRLLLHALFPRRLGRRHLTVDSVKSEFRGLGGGGVKLFLSDSGIARLTFGNPDRRNAVSAKMMCEFSDAVLELERWTAGKGLLISAASGVDKGVFCAGGDIRGSGDGLLLPENGAKMCFLMHDTVARLRALPLVSVCLVDGRAIGGGAELTLASDFRLFTARGQLAFVESNMGVTCGWGGGKMLTDLVGRTRALDLLLTCEKVDSRLATELGLCDGVVEDAEAAEEWLEDRVGRHDATVVRTVKAVCANAAENSDFVNALAVERSLFSPLWGGEANKKALAGNLKH